MAQTRRTQLLIILLLASAVVAVMAWSGLATRRGDAAASQEDLSACILELESINPKAAGAADASAAADDLAINRRLRGAAIAAHLSDQLASIEPGAPVQLRDSDTTQTPIYVRLNAVSLPQLVSFLRVLSSTDNGLRTSDIELSPGLATSPNRNDGGESWTADVTLSYLTVAQRDPSKAPGN
jgi:hypothetical protein